MEAIAVVVQVVATLAAVFAGIAALAIGAADRKNAREIAEADRRHASRQAQLVFEWEAAKRLSILEARGGHSDKTISQDMGAETLALIGLLGPDRVPGMWSRRIGKSTSELEAFVADSSKEQFLRDSVEAQLALDEIAREIRYLAHPTTK
jgi:hypothetical protein